jgi:hypothetical protein
MITSGNDSNPAPATTHKVVLPFYVYAALSFLAAAALLFTSSGTFSGHYFQPQVLAITHTMALGWGTMIILGASHQLLPVLIERKLYSTVLAHLSFAFAAVGIPLLIRAFYTFNMHRPAQYGALLINAGMLLFLVNVFASMLKSKSENIHAIFMLTAALWLALTTLTGGLLVFNFTSHLLSKDSLHYLSLHAHIGIVGWFLLLVIGVGSRLMPMFLISKYDNTKLLWWIYGLINSGLITFVLIFLYAIRKELFFIPVALIAIAILLFIIYCRQAYRQRVRREVDEPMKISLLSVLMMLLPLLFLVPVIVMLLFLSDNTHLVLVYGFTIFFGWLTAIILGMTFKTLPFIVWNKIYHMKAGLGKTPNPKDLFSSKVFNWMALSFLAGFLGFATGIVTSNGIILKGGALLILGCAFLYNVNVYKLIFHKEVKP